LFIFIITIDIQFLDKSKCFSLTANRCTTATYTKSDGKCFCAFFLERGLTWKQAADRCSSLGARLPEIRSAQENLDIFRLKVILSTVKPVYNGHPWDSKKVAVV
jgi:hypothetical protein